MSGPEQRPQTETAAWRHRLHTVLFEADTPGGKVFDVALLLAILASIVIVSLDTVESLNERYGAALLAAEWVLTALFTVEYVLRLLAVRRPLRYALSFYGIVDLVAVLPMWLMLVGVGSSSLIVVRAIRLLRVFRVLKLGRFLGEAAALRRALLDSRAKVTVFLTTVLVIVVVTGAALYLVEGEGSGFTSIPQSMYWAVVTLTTVGYGDVAPVTPLGKGLAAVLMLMGYSLIIVPTGILAAELGRGEKALTTQACPSCMAEGHDADARHCKACGAPL